jgi:PAS domain S-box-containing protein
MQAPAILAILKGPTHIFELANPPYIELIGNRNPVGKTVKEALPEIEGQGFFELLDNVYKTGETFIGTEVPVSLLRNGKLEELFVNFSYQAYKNAKGETEGILVFAYDVSEQVKARNIVIESTAKTKFMGEAMPQKVWTTDAEGNADYYNQHWVDFTGKSFDELYKWGWVDIIHPDDLENNLKVWKESINTGVDFQLEHRFRRRDGQYRWHLSRGVPQKNEDGKVIRWVGTSTDIHDLKTVQEELKRSYEDLEVKVKFRNIELERKVMELQKENSILSNSKK